MIFKKELKEMYIQQHQHVYDIHHTINVVQLRKQTNKNKMS